MTEILQRSYFDAAQKGRDAAQGEQINALNLKRGQQQYDQNVLAQQYQQEDRQAEQVKQFAQQMVQASQYASQAPPGQTKQFIERNFPFLVQTYGPGWQTATDDQIKGELQGIAAKYGVQAGIGPAPAPKQYQTQAGPRGSVLQVDPTTNETKQVVGPDNSQPAPPRAPARFRPMQPQEIQAAGLPPGTAAQVNDDTGAIQVLSKRDASSTLSQKDATTAKMKLTTLVLAKQQLQNIKDRFQKLKGTMSAGAFGQGKIPSEDGRAFDRSVDQMRSTLTALTRVPGVGAMSDYETKLDQSKFPTRDEYENVTEQQIGDLEAMLATIESGYRDLLSGGQQEQPQAAQGQPTLDEIRRKYGR